MRLGRVAAAVTLAGGMLASGAARAEKSAEEVCKDLAKKAQRTLWSSVRETGDALLCRKSWLPGRADELLACGAWTQVNLFGNKLKGAWNNFFWPLIVLDSERYKTLPLAIADLTAGKYVQSWPVRMASATVLTVPLIFVFLLFQRAFVRGVALTGVKE